MGEACDIICSKATLKSPAKHKESVSISCLGVDVKSLLCQWLCWVRSS